jgi:predicted amidohydrolase
MKISIIQPEPAWENKKANLEHLSEMMLPLSHETDIIILPEMFSTGFSMNTSLCEPYHGPTFDWMKKLSFEGGFAVCGSYMVIEKEKVYNRFVFVTSDEEYFYDKRHLFSIGEENRFFEKGNSRTIFSYKGWNISPFVCYDLRFPVWSRNRNDYDLAIYVSSWPEARVNVWNTLLRARAIENQCYVTGSNRIGIDGNGVRHNGMSQIIDPRGELILSAGVNEERVITADLSLEELRDFRKKFDVQRDADEFNIVIRPSKSPQMGGL